MAYNELQNQMRDRLKSPGAAIDSATSYLPGDNYDPPAAPQAPAAPAAPAAPKISSHYGAADPRGTEDMWFQFLNSNGYAKGASARGNGFYSGGGAYRGNLQGIVDQFNQQTGGSAKVAGIDKIDFGRGAQDVLTGAGQNDWWLSPAGGGAGGGAGAGGAAGAGQAGGVSPFQQQIRDFLMQQMAGLAKPVTADDPAISGELAAQRNMLERNRQDRRAASAERAAADGLLNGGQGSGSFEADVASGYEDKGTALSGIQAQLFGREIQARRDKLAQYVNMAMQSGDAESARALQLQLANMDDQLQRLNLNQRQSQHNDTFGLDAARFGYGKDRDAFLFGSGAN